MKNYTQNQIQAEILDGPYFQCVLSREDKCLIFAWSWDTNLGNVDYIKWLIFYWRRPFIRYIECFYVRN